MGYPLVQAGRSLRMSGFAFLNKEGEGPPEQMEIPADSGFSFIAKGDNGGNAEEEEEEEVRGDNANTGNNGKKEPTSEEAVEASSSAFSFMSPGTSSTTSVTCEDGGGRGGDSVDNDVAGIDSAISSKEETLTPRAYSTSTTSPSSRPCAASRAPCVTRRRRASTIAAVSSLTTSRTMAASWSREWTAGSPKGGGSRPSPRRRDALLTANGGRPPLCT